MNSVCAYMCGICMFTFVQVCALHYVYMLISVSSFIYVFMCLHVYFVYVYDACM